MSAPNESERPDELVEKKFGLPDSELVFRVDHSASYFRDTRLLLNNKLFEIREPFRMASEKKMTSKETSNYYSKLTPHERGVIELFLEGCNQSGSKRSTSETFDNNEGAKRLASKVDRLTSGLQTLEKDLIYSNISRNPVIITQALQDYFVPANCCFYIGDALNGLKKLASLISNNQKDLLVSENFLLVIDPPWHNKSVKRKRGYPLQNYLSILSACQALANILELLDAHQKDQGKKFNVKAHIWITEKAKDFAINQIIPTFKMKADYCFLWHKVTKNLESVKIRGGKEYILLASFKRNDTSMKSGAIVSIPSAIHSHKPPLPYNIIDDSVLMDFDPSQVDFVERGGLSFDKCPPLSGIELYARYLRPNFYSIGFEALKLQCSQLFTNNNKIASK